MAARIGLPVALALGILAVVAAFPNAQVAYAEIVPLVLASRLLGFRTALVLALGAAVGLEAFRVALRPGTQGFDAALDAASLAAVFVAVLALATHYEGVLTARYERQSAARAREREVARIRDLTSIAEASPELCWTYRDDGTGEYFNAAWLAYTGLDRVSLEIGGLAALVHPADVAAVRSWRPSGDAAGASEIEIRLRDRDGGFSWFLARATPLLADDGATILRWFGTCTNIDARKRGGSPVGPDSAAARPVPADVPPGAPPPVAGAGFEAGRRAVALPETLPQVAGLRFDADRAVAGGAEADAGRDWYDAFRLIDGRVLLSVGDVTGHGAAVATAIVAVRQAIRGAAALHAEPLAVLESADRILRDGWPDVTARAFAGIYDPMVWELRFASAGHPAPRMRGPTGEMRDLLAPGRPLGAWRTGDAEAAFAAVDPGSVLVLVSGPSLLTVAFDGEVDAEAPLRRRWRFDSRDVAAARAATAGVMAAVAATGATQANADDAETVARELVANVTRHAPGACEVVLDATGGLPVLGVLDRGRGRPLTHTACLPVDAFAASGRGLFIVRALTVDFSACPRIGGGTTARAVLHARFTTSRAAAPLSR